MIFSGMDIAGDWSLVKAKKIQERLEEQHPLLKFDLIDVTTFNDPHPRVIFSVWCRRHDSQIQMDSVCDECLLETIDHGNSRETT